MTKFTAEVVERMRVAREVRREKLKTPSKVKRRAGLIAKAKKMLAKKERKERQDRRNKERAEAWHMQQQAHDLTRQERAARVAAAEDKRMAKATQWLAALKEQEVQAEPDPELIAEKLAKLLPHLDQP